MNDISEEKPVNAGDVQGTRNDKGQFVPGVSGNPKGKEKGTRNFTTKVKEALETIAEGKDYTYEEAFIKSILKKAIVDGDSSTQKLIWNYLDGMPSQSVDLKGSLDIFIDPEQKKVIEDAVDEVL
jgi:hypothetical protein